MEGYIYTIYSLFFFIVGTLFGSFFSLATYRIPRKLDIVKTRSFCPNCKHNLGFWDCFPILSFVTSFGKCRYCKQKISPRYLLLEVVNGLVFLLAYMFIGIRWQLFIALACYIYLVLVIGSDIMKAKMTEQEVLEVNKRVEEKNSNRNKSKKVGALTLELAIAFVLFVAYFMVASNTIANYSKSLGVVLRRAEAMNLCLNVVNKEKIKDFAYVTTYTSSETIENTTYTYTVRANKYTKDTVVFDEAYDINVKVTFDYLGEEFSYDLSFLKVNE